MARYTAEQNPAGKVQPAHGHCSFWEGAVFLPMEQSTLAGEVRMRKREELGG